VRHKTSTANECFQALNYVYSIGVFIGHCICTANKFNKDSLQQMKLKSFHIKDFVSVGNVKVMYSVFEFKQMYVKKMFPVHRPNQRH
jgi:hypothetical protein